MATVTAVPEEVRTGGEFELRFTVSIAPGHHVYAADDGPYTPLRLTLDLPPVLETAGDVRVPEATDRSDGRPVHRGRVVVTQPVRFLPGAEAGSYEVTARLRYQVCNDLLCRPPESSEITFPVVVEPGG